MNNAFRLYLVASAFAWAFLIFVIGNNLVGFVFANYWVQVDLLIGVILYDYMKAGHSVALPEPEPVRDAVAKEVKEVRAYYCPHCGAPLQATSGSVTCGYCGTRSRIS